MSSSHVDRNLLFGFLALQNNFLSREDLIAAVSAWLLDKSRPLDEILRERRALADDEHQLLAALVRKHLDRHGDNPEKSLAALSSVVGLRDDLKKLGDADVEASLAHVSVNRPAEDSQFARTLPPDDSQSAGSRFRILRPHAEGGLGQVFVAQDQELNREVALKEIKLLRADDPDSRSRFMLEAEITGGLEHPGIVPVYGLGQYADGRPFYAMRFIRGDSLAEAVDRFHAVGQTFSLPSNVGQASRLPKSGATAGSSSSARSPASPSYDSVEFRKLLGRFIDVCNAIEYAHSRGILHRDLKPCNIMLGKYGETLVVDWGLAKAQGRDEQHRQSDEHTLQPRSGSGSSATLVGQAIGTPAFMSPEQAAGRLDQLGPASDVYSLGATLYYVLTGQTPFGKESIGAVLRKVQSGDFAPPRAIKPQIPKSLEAICLNAMRRKSSDRYESPQLLADDVERYLADEPVLAHAEPVALRARRWLRKHPRSVAALAATLLVGITSAAMISAIVAGKNQQLIQANAGLLAANLSEREATTAAETKRQEAERARENEARARTRAETAEATARTNEQQALVSAEAERQAKEAAQLSEKKALAAEADTKAFSNFLERRVLAVARPQGLQGGLGVNVTVAQALEEAEKYLQADFADRPLAEALARHAIAVTWRNRDRFEQAEAHLRRAIELRALKLGSDHADTLNSLNSLGVLLDQMGRYDESIDIHKQSLEQHNASLGPKNPGTIMSMHNLAAAYQFAGRLTEALPLIEQTLELRKAELGPGHPDTLRSMNNLANAYQSMGRLTEALLLFEQTLELNKAKLGPEHPYTLLSMNNLAYAYQSAGRLTEALPLFEQTLKLRTVTLGPQHPDTLTSMDNLAEAYRSAGRLAEALPLHEQTLELRKGKLGPEHPSTLTSMNDLALAYQSAGRLTEALPLLEQALKLRKAKFGPAHPYTLLSMSNLAYAYQSAGRLAEALPLSEQTLELRKVKLGPEHPDTLTSMSNLAGAYQTAARLAEALPLLERTLELRKAKLGPEHPDTLMSMGNLATSYLAAKHTEKGVRLFEQYVAGHRKRAKAYDPAFATVLATTSHFLLSDVQYVPAETYLRECLLIRKKNLPDDWSLFNTMSMLGSALAGQQKFAEAEPLLVEGYQGMKHREARIPPQGKLNITEALRRLVDLYTTWSKPDEAAKWRKVLDEHALPTAPANAGAGDLPPNGNPG